jgi:LmbE family N-acetylglucosaminyl deacetylase
MNKTILIVAAHADDEVLGCGGTIRRHVAEGDKVHLVIMADGVNARTTATSVDLDQRVHAMRNAQSILGINTVEWFGFPDNCLDSIPMLKIIQRLEQVIDNLKPSIIYTHHHGDLNIDHRITHDAVMTSCRPQPRCGVQEILGFEILSSTEWGAPNNNPFLPNMFIDITGYLNDKIMALNAYSEEMRAEPHSRSVLHAEILARHRGFCVGVSAAEAFMVYRIVVK